MFRHITLLIVFCFAEIFWALTVWALPDPSTVFLLQSFHDGSLDEASDKTVAILRQKFSGVSSLHLVDPTKVDEVLSYYKNNPSSNGASEMEEAKDLLGQAREHYFQFAYVEAQAELKRAIGLLEADPKRNPEGGQTLLDGWVTLGLVHAAQGKKSEAVSDFETVLRFQPFYKLDLKDFPPSIHRLFEQARNEYQKKSDATIQIATDPKVAEVYLNGVYQGVAPLSLSPLPSGEYSLSFKANNYQTKHQNIFLSPGENVKIHPKLPWTGVQKEGAGRSRAERQDARHQIEEGVRIANLLKADKVLFVDVDEGLITARLVDYRYRAGHNPILIPLKEGMNHLEENLDQLVRFVVAQTELNLLKNPMAHLDPDGVGDPILLGRQRKKISKGFLFGGLSLLGIGGLLAGVLASGGDQAPRTGTLSLSFK